MASVYQWVLFGGGLLVIFSIGTRGFQAHPARAGLLHLKGEEGVDLQGSDREEAGKYKGAGHEYKGSIGRFPKSLEKDKNQTQWKTEYNKPSVEEKGGKIKRKRIENNNKEENRVRAKSGVSKKSITAIQGLVKTDFIERGSKDQGEKRKYNGYASNSSGKGCKSYGDGGVDKEKSSAVQGLVKPGCVLPEGKSQSTGQVLNNKRGEPRGEEEEGFPFQRKGEGGPQGPYRDVYVKRALKDCSKTLGFLACFKYLLLNYLTHFVEDSGSTELWGPVIIVKTGAAEEPKEAELEPRSAESEWSHLTKFVERTVERYTSTHALAISTDATGRSASGRRKKIGKGMHGKRTAQVVLPLIALTLFKIKIIGVSILMLLACIKQFMMLASVMMPLVSRINLWGKTGQEAQQPGQTPAGYQQAEPGQYTAAGSYPYSSYGRPPQQQYRTIIQGAGDSWDSPYKRRREYQP